MSHRLLLIEPNFERADDSLAPFLAAEAAGGLEQANWEALSLEGLPARAVDMIVAVAIPPLGKAPDFFHWLRQHPIGIPTLAILSETADEELLRHATEAADDFTLWPVRPQELRRRVTRLLGPGRQSIEAVRRRLTEEIGLSELVGNDPTFTRIVGQLPSIARSDSPVLITGETGTGKELCARAIHHLSKRRDFPFIAVDCAVVPDHLFENEFFGHARGAFTDAHRDHKGLVALAEGGTLFLDEIDALSLTAQAKLLRLLQEHTFKPLGSEQFVQADLNVIAATNCDLEARVRDRQFRSDLWFRLNVFQAHLPPLRERRGDIPLLAAHFLDMLQRRGDRRRKSFAPSTLHSLSLYDWPGNVRELLNVVRRAHVLCDGAHILPSHLSLSTASPVPLVRAGSFRQGRAAAIATFERHYVGELLRRHQGNVTWAAREAGKDRRAFGRLVKKYNIERRAVV